MDINLYDLLLEFYKNNSIENLCKIALAKFSLLYPTNVSAICLQKLNRTDQESKYVITATHSINQEQISLINPQQLDSWIDNLVSKEYNDRRIGKPDSAFFPSLIDSKISWSCAIPLQISKEKILGIFWIGFSEEKTNRFIRNSNLIKFVNNLSLVLHIALDVFRNQIQSWTSTILLQAAENAQTINQVDDLFRTMVTLTILLTGVKHCGFFLYNSSSHVFCHKYSYELELKPNQEISVIDYPFLESIIQNKTTSLPQNLPVNNFSEIFGFLPGKEIVQLIPLTRNSHFFGFFLVSLDNSLKDFNYSSMGSITNEIINGIVEQTIYALDRIRTLEEQEEDTYVTAVLSQVSQAIVSLNKFDDILNNILDSLPIFMGIDYSTALKWEDETQSFSFWKLPYQSQKVEEISLNHKLSATASIFLNSIRLSNAFKSINFHDFIDSPKDSKQQHANSTLTFQQQGMILGFPISYQDNFFGVLLIKESQNLSRFHEKRLKIMTGIAQQIGLAIQNQKFLGDSLEKEKLQNEVQLARQIQLTFLPDSLLKISGWNMAVRWITARQVGGDFYDYFFLDNNHIALVIADVADKGVPASLYMTVTRTLIRAFSKGILSPTVVMNKVNEQLLRETPNSLFVTAVLGFLSLSSGLLTYTIAGHPLPIIFRSKSKGSYPLNKCGMALGISEDALLTDKKVKIFKGDTLLFYSDGLPDTVNIKMKSYEEKRLIKLLSNKKFNSAEDVLSIIEKDIKRFRGEAAVVDDLTMLAITRV